MKRKWILVFTLFFIMGPLLSALDIFLNGVFWGHYSHEELEALALKASGEEEEGPVVPFAQLLPLMERTDNLFLEHRDGTSSLSPSCDDFQRSRLFLHSEFPQLQIGENRFSGPELVNLEGEAFQQKNILIWAEPGLAGFEQEVQIWSRLHKIRTEYREVPGIRDELMYRQMTGEEVPDLLLVFASAHDPRRNDFLLAYVLEGCFKPEQASSRILLPQGERLNGDLFLSLLASRLPGGNPWQPFFLKEHILNSPGILEAAARNYFRLVWEGRIMDEPDKNDKTVFFPARGFAHRPEISSTGVIHPLGLGGKTLPARIFPLGMEFPQEEFKRAKPLESLTLFLKMPGIQSQFLSVPKRQLPADFSVLDNRSPGSPEDQLLEEWKRGYILWKGNSKQSCLLIQDFPDFYREKRDFPFGRLEDSP